VAGTYTVSLSVVDDAGIASAPITQQLTIAPAPPPVAQFKCRCRTPRAGRVLAFDASSSRARAAGIVRWVWRFGDGAHATGARPRHRFRRPGWYRVSVTVTDAFGHSATFTRRVRVVGRGAH
jgi:PKD repeat protein